MDINRAMRIIKGNCKISSILPISGECSKDCEFYCNCLRKINPCHWETPIQGKAIILEAINSIHKYCMDSVVCKEEECEFYSLCCQEVIPSFWQIKDSIDIE